jgi:hypothetical protein
MTSQRVTRHPVDGRADGERGAPRPVEGVEGAPASGPRTGPLTWLKRRGTYTPVCRGRLPIPKRRFEHAKG